VWQLAFEYYLVEFHFVKGLVLLLSLVHSQFSCCGLHYFLDVDGESLLDGTC
jgi:hypothetical protein